jgi:peptidoglycan/xylan/chitin deacetylase (PgdA/CDA1 family)
MNPQFRTTVTRSRSAILVFALTFASLISPAGASAADAPNTCAGATSASALNAWLTDTISSSSDVDWYRFVNPSSRRALVTLGNLPADYDLFLYSSCSTPLASSHRSGRQYDEIYRNLPAGTYFVRVAGYAGASSPSAYALRFRPLAEGVHVLSYTGWTDATGRRHLAGEILNNTSDRRRHVQLNATLYNSSNVAIGSAVGYAELDVVSPRGRSPFEIVTKMPAGYHHSSVSVAKSSVTTAAPVGGLAVTAGAPYTDSSGARHFPGNLRNSNATSVYLTHVLTTLYDAYGQVRGLGWAFTNPAAIGAGATATFDVKPIGIASPNRVAYTPQASRANCSSGPRYNSTTQENFLPPITRTSAANRVALTFDMGGRMDPAVDIINTLVRHRICATIFPTGAISQTARGQAALSLIKQYPQLFELGNHTMNHCDLVRGGGGAPVAAQATICAGYAPSPTETQVKNELVNGDTWIREYTKTAQFPAGMPTRSFWRAPYGSYNSTVLTWAAEAGWPKHFRWDVDTIDWKPISDGGPTARSMATKVVDNAKSGTVVLMHLGGFETLDALPAMIDGLQGRGFTLTSLSDMTQ